MMERLTEKLADGGYITPFCTRYDDEKHNEWYCGTSVDQLAAYEDTGLEPKEIAKLQLAYDAVPKGISDVPGVYETCFGAPLAKIKRLLDAEQDGRLVALPCKPGERWKDKWGDIFIVVGFHFDEWAGWTVLYRAENEEKNGDDLLAVNFVYWQHNLTREASKGALAAESAP